MNALRPPFMRHAQSGFSMLVVLLLMIVLTLIGVSAMNMSRLSEKIAGARYSQTLAFAAAQAALSEGVDFILDPSFNWASPNSKVREFSVTSSAADEGWSVRDWVKSNTDWYNGPYAHTLQDRIMSGPVTQMSRNPSFIIDKMPSEQTQNGISYQVYRITARGEPRDSSRAAYIQSIIKLPIPN